MTYRCQHRDEKGEQCRLWDKHLAEHLCTSDAPSLLVSLSVKEEIRLALTEQRERIAAIANDYSKTFEIRVYEIQQQLLRGGDVPRPEKCAPEPRTTCNNAPAAKGVAAGAKSTRHMGHVVFRCPQCMRESTSSTIWSDSHGDRGEDYQPPQCCGVQSFWLRWERQPVQEKELTDLEALDMLFTKGTRREKEEPAVQGIPHAWPATSSFDVAQFGRPCPICGAAKGLPCRNPQGGGHLFYRPEGSTKPAEPAVHRERVASIEELIDRSSLGTPEAKEIRASAPRDVIEKTIKRADQLDAADRLQKKLASMSLDEIRSFWTRLVKFAADEPARQDGFTDGQESVRASIVAYVRRMADEPVLVVGAKDGMTLGDSWKTLALFIEQHRDEGEPR